MRSGILFPLYTNNFEASCLADVAVVRWFPAIEDSGLACPWRSVGPPEDDVPMVEVRVFGAVNRLMSLPAHASCLVARFFLAETSACLC